ncbi:MAG: phenylalanine--tRNA ligase subunit beta [archaeon]
MTILTINRKKFERKIGKLTKELEEKISMFGTPIEEVSDDELSVEVFPNRPDLLSAGNFMRAINQFVVKGRVASFNVNKPEKDFVVTIDKSVKEVRPHSVCAIVKGMRFDDEKIKEIVDIQEKLHGSIGRKRRKLAIGIYPLDKIKLPIRFVGRKPEDIKFMPLEARAEMTGRQILRGHPAGREYGDLLKGCGVFPVFVDANDEILSMPPIINSEKTGRIDEKTRDIFIECSGHNLVYLKKCLNIIVAAISEMGGKVYAMDVKDYRDGNFVSPDMSPEKMDFRIEDVEKTLGIKLSEKEIVGYLARMGIASQGVKSQAPGVREMVADVPAYRMDILHWIDLAEEVAIAYGYDKFESEIPKISTIAEENPADRMKRVIGNILAGLGFLECSSFHLTTKKDVRKMHYDFNDFVEVENSKTGRDVLRIDLLTGLLQIASENSDAAYPHKIFEIGRVFSKGENETMVLEKEKLAIALVDESVNFTEMKQVLDYLFKMLGIEYLIEAVDTPSGHENLRAGDSNYIIGRCGKIVVGGKEIGRIGEIAPRVLKNWKIKMPVVGMEIGVDFN